VGSADRVTRSQFLSKHVKRTAYKREMSKFSLHYRHSPLVIVLLAYRRRELRFLLGSSSPGYWRSARGCSARS
jgi:hypothetical protein